MLTLSEISKAYGGRVLFDDVTLQLNRGDRIGLVGPNGAGKSTLFSIILGEEAADSGQVMQERNVVFGYLPQESAPVGDETVLELATAISPEFAKLRRLIMSWDSDHPSSRSCGRNPRRRHNRFDELGGYQLDAKAKQILSGLGFREKDFDRPARELSGGWVMRAHLARLLVQQPDLLLLDEPTNHLDLEALIWFQEYLKTYPGAIVVISHDREFLNQLVGGIVEIRQSRLIRYRGNYDEYLVQRAAHEEQLLAAYKNQQRDIAAAAGVRRPFPRQGQQGLAGAEQAQADRAHGQDRGAGERRAARSSSSFPQPQRSGQRVITLENIHHAYGENVVYRGMDFQAERGQRIVLVGPNGAGKSTLLKILAGRAAAADPARASSATTSRPATIRSIASRCCRHRGHGVRGGVGHAGSASTEQFIRTLLGCFLFRGDDVFKKVSVSERRRKKPARAREAAARSAEPAADGRADDASGHGEHRRVGRRAEAVSRARWSSSATTFISSARWPTTSSTSTPGSSRIIPAATSIIWTRPRRLPRGPR